MKWEFATRKRGVKLKWHTVTADTEQEAQEKASKIAKDSGERIYAGVFKKRNMGDNALSFDIDNKEQFRFFKKNDFEDGEVHYLFENGKFLFWVVSKNGVLQGVSGTDRSEMESWNDEDPDGKYGVTDKAYAIHLRDAQILSRQENLKKIEEMIKRL